MIVDDEALYDRETIKYTYQEAREAAVANAAAMQPEDGQQEHYNSLHINRGHSQDLQQDPIKPRQAANSNEGMEQGVTAAQFPRSRSNSGDRMSSGRWQETPGSTNQSHRGQWKEAATGPCSVTTSAFMSKWSSGSHKSEPGVGASFPGGLQWGMDSAAGSADPYGLPGEEAACTLHDMRDWLGEQEEQMAVVRALPNAHDPRSKGVRKFLQDRAHVRLLMSLSETGPWNTACKLVE